MHPIPLQHKSAVPRTAPRISASSYIIGPYPGHTEAPFNEKTPLMLLSFSEAMVAFNVYSICSPSDEFRRPCGLLSNLR